MTTANSIGTKSAYTCHKNLYNKEYNIRCIKKNTILSMTLNIIFLFVVIFSGVEPLRPPSYGFGLLTQGKSVR